VSSTIRLLLAGALTVSAALGQRPKFDVASIKACAPRPVAKTKGPPGESAPPRSSPGRYQSNCDTLIDLIRTAYVDNRGPTPQRLPVTGGPAWINSDRYQIVATAEANASMPTMTGPMLQSLLEDRFGLKIHRETREVPVYLLNVAKNGLKIQPLKEGTCFSPDAGPPPDSDQKPCGIPFTRVKPPNMIIDMEGTLSNLSKLLGVTLGRPVIDKTGVTGQFGFHLEFARDEAASDVSAGPSIFTALQELGLKLDSAKGPGEFLVIDSVERPSEN
jgi:uncharacterized protein (TIGR03435 family)